MTRRPKHTLTWAPGYPQCFDRSEEGRTWPGFSSFSCYIHFLCAHVIVNQNVSCMKSLLYVLFELVGWGTQSRFLQDSEALHRKGKLSEALIPQSHFRADRIKLLHIQPVNVAHRTTTTLSGQWFTTVYCVIIKYSLVSTIRILLTPLGL